MSIKRIEYDPVPESTGALLKGTALLVLIYVAARRRKEDPAWPWLRSGLFASV